MALQEVGGGKMKEDKGKAAHEGAAHTWECTLVVARGGRHGAVRDWWNGLSAWRPEVGVGDLVGMGLQGYDE